MDDTEGLTEEEAALAAGREMLEQTRQSEGQRPSKNAYSDTASLDIGSVASDIGMLLDVDSNVDPTEDMLCWVPNEDEALEPLPPEAEIPQVTPGQAMQTRVLETSLLTVLLDGVSRGMRTFHPT